VNHGIYSAQRFNIYISALGIPLNLILGNDCSAHKTLHGMTFTLKVANKCGSDKTGGASDCDALWN
jgi:hypothetical protein